MSEEKLTRFLKTSKDWYKLKTSIPSVFFLKLSAYRSGITRLAFELNPADDAGQTKKYRGLVLRSSTKLEECKELLQHEKLSNLLKIFDQVNPKVEAAKPMKGEDAVEM